MPQTTSILELYKNQSDELYNKLSPYSGVSNSNSINFGCRQPYVYKKLTEVGRNTFSSTLNKISNVASQAGLNGLPNTSAIADVVRMSKFMASSNGIFFIGKQLLLQRFQPFNETRIYNPLSIVQSAASHVSLGLLGRPTRHFDTNNVLSTLTGGTFSNSNPTQIPGTAPKALIGGPNQNQSSGLIRSQTANLARSNLELKYRNQNNKSGLSINLGGIIGAAKSAIDSFVVREQKQDHRADEDTYDLMIKKRINDRNNTTSNVNVSVGNPEEITKKPESTRWHNDQYTPESTYIDSINSNEWDEGTPTKYELPNQYDTKTIDRISTQLNKMLNNEKIHGVRSGYNSPVDLKYLREDPKKPNALEGSTYYNRYKELNRFAPNWLASEVGESGIMSSEPKMLYGENDIPFYFHDMVNDRYIPFAATVKGMSDAFQSEWSEVKYIGRADKLYNYNGFSRAVNFSFVVYCNSINELMPMWKRINYLCGLTKPSKYIDSNVTGQTAESNYYLASFIVPPMVKLTIGDFYKNHPYIIDSVNIQIPDDAQWETLPETENAYEYGQISINLGVGRLARFPRVCEISINGKMLEKERPQTGHANWGDCLLTEKESSKNYFSSNLIVT